MQKLRASVVSFPVSEAFVTPLSNLTEILCYFSDDVYVITGSVKDVKVKMKRKKSIQTYSVRLKETNNLPARILRYICMQIQVSLLLLVKLPKKVDLIIFFMQSGLFLPALIAKLFRKKILLVLPSSITQLAKRRDDFVDKILISFQALSYELADRIVIYSPNLITEWDLEKYQHKILIAHEHFIDFTKFKSFKKLDERLKLVGYLGRLSMGKGVSKLVEAMPLILDRGEDIRFVICGDGDLADGIKETIKAENLEAYVKLTGWISHEDVPRYLNEFRLLVLPSFTEGLPNTMIEAMACGTPVLATSVGAMPDIIMEGRTGFSLKSNDPKHIAERIVNILDKPEILKNISISANRYTKENFSYERTLKDWRKIFIELEMHNCLGA